MRVGYLCRQLTSHTFMRDHNELKTLLHLWERLFTYTTIQEESIFRSAIIERSGCVWKREIGEERWREACDVTRENDTTHILFLSLYVSYPYLFGDNTHACRAFKHIVYHHLP